MSTQTATPEPVTTPGAPSGTIADVLASNSDLSMFADAVTKFDLQDMLSQPGWYTLFAPTNEALNAMSPSDRNTLLGSADMVKGLLKRSLVSDSIPEANFASLQFTESQDGTALMFSTDSLNDTLVNGFKVVKSDVAATNGYIQVIDGVLYMPPATTSTPQPTSTP